MTCSGNVNMLKRNTKFSANQFSPVPRRSVSDRWTNKGIHSVVSERQCARANGRKLDVLKVGNNPEPNRNANPYVYQIIKITVLYKGNISKCSTAAWPQSYWLPCPCSSILLYVCFDDKLSYRTDSKLAIKHLII